MSVTITAPVLLERKSVIELVVSKSVISLIMGGLAIQRIEVWANVIWVLPVKGSPRFLSKKSVWKAFQDLRRNYIDDLFVLPFKDGSGAIVKNKSKDSSYRVTQTPEGLCCQCLDFERQRQVLGVSRSACKHIYAYRKFVGV